MPETRKTVTVLFTDLSGYTGLGERLDPEPLRRVMTRYFEEMRAVVERHGGTVEKYIGDAIMAVFGVPTVHEDDALRAVRAAAEMREVLTTLNEELERDRGVTIGMRTGVNTGEVVAGDPRAGEPIFGDAVTVAARLEQTASPGEVLIGESTGRLVRDSVVVERVEPLTVKGKAAPVQAFRLVEVPTSGEAIVRPLISPLVGRQAELAVLEEAFERATAERTCRLVTIVGAAGVGKTRLADEFLRRVGDRATTLQGRCLPYGEGITYWPIVEIVREAAGFDPGASPEEARAAIDALLAGQEHATRVGEQIAQVVGLGAAEAVPDETFWSIRRLLETLGGTRPVVVVLEDIHWGEPMLLDLVDYLIDFAGRTPILVLGLGRPEVLEGRPAWAGDPLLALEPLSDRDTHSLIDNLLEGAPLGAEVLARIDEAADGNPLFVEETLLMLIDDGLLRRDDGRWAAAGDLSEVPVPPTIQALLAARLDRLPAEERAVIERASVVGKVFYWGAIAELSPEPMRGSVGAHLMSLARKDLIRSEPSDVGDAFRFRHILIRDAAYRGIPKETRADLHEGFADWLEGRAGGGLSAHEEILAYHLEEALRYRIELGPAGERERALSVRAGGLLASAGRRAAARGDPSAAIHLLERAVALFPPGPARVEPAIDLSEAYREAGDFAKAERVLAEATAQTEGDPRLHALAGVESWMLRLHADPATSADEALAEAVGLIRTLEEIGDHAGLAKAWRLSAMTHWSKARFGDMESALERALDHAERGRARGEEAESLLLLAVATLSGPAPVEEGIRRTDEILRRGDGNRRVEASTQLVRGTLLALLGRFDEARDLIRRGRDGLLELGAHTLVAAASHHAGLLERLAGNLEEAERELRSGYESFDRMGERSLLSSSATYLGQVLHEEGRNEEAEEFTRIAESTALADDLYTQVGWRGVRARVLAAGGRTAEAESLAREAVALAEVTDSLSLQGDALLDLAEVLRVGGRTEEARSEAESALERYRRKGDLVSARKAEDLMAAG